MKKLFYGLVTIVVVVLGTPTLLAYIMYDGSGEAAMPVELYTEDADAEQMIMEELTASLDAITNETEEDFIFNLHEDIINVAIFQAIRDENPDYMPTDDCDTPEACYVSYNTVPIEDFNMIVRLVGAWVDFSEDAFNFNVFLEVELEDGFTYKTIVKVDFDFNDYDDYYFLEFKEISIGNLPIPATLISNILEQLENNIEGFDMESAVTDLEYGEADVNEFTFKLYKSEVVELLTTGDSCDPTIDEDCDGPIEEKTTETLLMEQMLSEIFEQQILIFKFENDELIATAQLSMFKSEDQTDLPSYLYDLHTVDAVTGEIGDYDPMALDTDTYLGDLFTEYVFNYALTNEGFRITEETFNKLIYSSQNGFEENMQANDLELPDGTVRTLEYGMRGLWFEMSADGIQAKALIQLDSVESIVNLKASKVDAESDDQQLVFEFVEITFGEDQDEVPGDFVTISDLSIFKQLLAEIGDVEFGSFDQDGKLTISAGSLTAMMQDGSEQGTVNVTGIALVEGAIVLEIEPADANLQAALDNFTGAINTVVENPQLLTDLESVLDTTTEGPEQEVFEAVQDLQETLQNEEVPTTEDVEALFDNYEQMDDEAQQAFLEAFEGLIDPNVFSGFEDLYGDVTEEE